jgi:DNA-binding response OmpR family regulator
MGKPMLDHKEPLILVVDDSYMNLQFLGNMLSKNGYKLALATNGFESLDFAKKKLPDLILLDVMMPKMDGFEVCKRLKKGIDTKQIPVIFLTAKTDAESIIQGFEAGGVDYVTKPFNPAELLARVRTQIKLKQAFDEINTLKGFIPICAKCKSIRDDNGYWEKVEKYIESHSEAVFSHSICPNCTRELYPELHVEGGHGDR